MAQSITNTSLSPLPASRFPLPHQSRLMSSQARIGSSALVVPGLVGRMKKTMAGLDLFLGEIQSSPRYSKYRGHTEIFLPHNASRPKYRTPTEVNTRQRGGFRGKGTVHWSFTHLDHLDHPRGSEVQSNPIQSNLTSTQSELTSLCIDQPLGIRPDPDPDPLTHRPRINLTTRTPLLY